MSVDEIRDQVAGLADFEIGDAPRTRPVSYALTLPTGTSASKPARGLVFDIPGFGADNDPGYLANLRRTIAEVHGYACVSVDYHAIAARPSQGCAISLEPESMEVVRLLAHRHGVVLDEGNIGALLQSLGARVPAQVKLRATLEPPLGEYQNFGVLQALDHLVVLDRLAAAGVACDFHNVVLVGSSHGGYIAHLIAKFAPNSINAVIDNSSYVRAPLQYLGLLPEFNLAQGNLTLDCSVASRWQFLSPQAPGYYGLAQALIRDTSYAPHLAEMRRKGDRLPHYFCFNSVADAVISPIHFKRYQRTQLQAVGAVCRLEEITAADIDGKLWKTLDHGMNASLKGLCERVLPEIAARPTTLDQARGTVLEFDGADQMYRITHGAAGQGVQAELITRD
jgi:pimeloyl-ACP methyl ester carboxylesterase